jgi:glycerate-2-kinase
MLFNNFKKIVQNGANQAIRKKREDILKLFSVAVEAVDPYKIVKSTIKGDKIFLKDSIFDLKKYNNIFVIGFGKASVGMTQAVCDSIDITKGIVITNNINAKVKHSQVETIHGSHPIPDISCVEGTNKILYLVKNCKRNDLLIVMISGGGSSLLCKPKIKLKTFQQTSDLLIKSGANISEINTVRKHLSNVKGGQLAKVADCQICSLIISDIIGDPIESIASGPTFPDCTTYSDAYEVLQNYDLVDRIPDETLNVIKDGVSGILDDTPKKEDVIFEKVSNKVIASNSIACNAAAVKAKEFGYSTRIFTISLEGEAKEMGKYIIDKTKILEDSSAEDVIISGGETTVKVKGDGIGGRNQELLLGAIKRLNGTNTVFSSFATDGIDGNSDAAGAIADGNSYLRALKKNLKFKEFLLKNNSYNFFKNLDDLLFTGDTGTNVMDLQIIIK